MMTAVYHSLIITILLSEENIYYCAMQTSAHTENTTKCIIIFTCKIRNSGGTMNLKLKVVPKE